MRSRLLPLVLAGALLAACVDADRGAPEEGPTSTPTTEEDPDDEAAGTSCPDGITPARAPAASGSSPSVSVDEATRAAGAGVLDIGTLLPLSGELAFLGPAQHAAVELAVADINAAGGVLGAPVTLTHADSGDPGAGGAEAETRRLLEAGVDVIIGPTSEATTLAVIDDVVAAGSVLFSPANNSPAFTDYDDQGQYFRTSASDVLQGRALARLVATDGFERVAVIARDDGYSRPIRRSFEAEATVRDLTVTSSALHSSVDGIASAVEQALEDAPDAVVVIGRTESALVVDALTEADHAPAEHPVYGVSGNMGARMAEAVEEPSRLACMRGIVAAAPTPAGLRRRLLEHAPDLGDLSYAAEAYDAVVISALAAELAGSDAGTALAREIPGVTRDGTPCSGAEQCLDLVRDPETRASPGVVDLDGMAGSHQFSLTGEPTVAGFRVVQFDAGGRLSVVGQQTAAVP